MSILSSSKGSECLRVQSLLEQAEHWASQNEPERARRLFLAAISLDPGLKSLWEFARFLADIGEEPAAIEQLATLWNEAKRRTNAAWVIAACEGLAILHRNRGQWAIAESYQQQAISARVGCLGLTSDDVAPISELLGLANAAILRGDLAYAEQLANIVLDCSEHRDCESDIADACGTRGAIFLLQRQLEPAWESFVKAYALHCRADDEAGRMADLLNLAAVCREEGRWELARRLLVKASRVAKASRAARLLQKAERLRDEAERVLAVADRMPEWN